MKKKKNLSNPTVELSYQLNILNLTEPKTKTKKTNPSTPIRRKEQKDETHMSTPHKTKICKIIIKKFKN